MIVSRSLGCLSLLACLVMLGFHQSEGAVLGIDLSSEFIKVSAVRPGTTFHIVVDEMSKRKIVQAVAWDDGERLFGNAAVGLAIRKPADTFLWAHRMIGKPLGHPDMIDITNTYPYAYESIEGRNGAIGLRYGGTLYHPEELLAMSLQHVLKIVQDEEKMKIKDAVITVPSWFLNAERQAVLDAADIAGVNVLGLINENAGALITYGIDREYKNDTSHTALFYNMGSTGTQVTLARYTAYVLGKGKYNKTIGQVEVLEHASDCSLGGTAFDNVLVNWMIEKYETKFNDKTVRQNVRTMAKLRKQANSVKTVLSANQDTVIYAESLHNNNDFKQPIKREEFMESAQPLVAKCTETVKEVLEKHNMKGTDLDAAVIIGGGVRIPAIQTALKEYLGRDMLDQNINGDEAMTMGAVFRAANYSTAHQVRPFGLIDIQPYAIGCKIASFDENESTQYRKKATLFARNSPLNKRKSVVIEHDQDVNVLLQYTDMKGLPVAHTDKETYYFASYDITGMDKVRSNEKYAELLKEQKPKIAIGFRLTDSGVASVTYAEATMEETVKVKIAKKQSAKKDEKDQKELTEEEKKLEEELKKLEEEKEEFKMEKKVHRVPLKVKRAYMKGASFGIMPMSKRDKKGAAEHLAELNAKDEKRRLLAQAKNTLESTIYNTKNELWDDEIQEVTSEEQREAIRAALTKAEEWMNAQTQETDIKDYKEQADALIDIYAPVLMRKKEAYTRPDTVVSAEKLVKSSRILITEWKDTRPWLNATTDVAPLSEYIDALEAFLKEKTEAQKALKPYEDPAFKSADLYPKMKKIVDQTKECLRKKKPYVPKPKADNNKDGEKQGAKKDDKDGMKEEAKKGEKEGETKADEKKENEEEKKVEEGEKDGNVKKEEL